MTECRKGFENGENVVLKPHQKICMPQRQKHEGRREWREKNLIGGENTALPDFKVVIPTLKKVLFALTNDLA